MRTCLTNNAVTSIRASSPLVAPALTIVPPGAQSSSDRSPGRLTDVLEDDARTVAAGRGEHVGDQPGRVVVEDEPGLRAAQELPLLLASGARDHARAGEGRDLDPGTAQPARARPHEDGVRRGDGGLADQHLPGRDVCVGKGGDVLVRDRRVDRDGEPRRHEEELGVGAVVDAEERAVLKQTTAAALTASARHVRVGSYAVARRKALHLGTGCDDVATDVDPEDARQVEAVRGMGMAAPHPDVAVVDRGRAEPYEQVARPGVGLGDLLEA